MTNHDGAVTTSSDAFVRTFRWHSDRVVARLVASVPGVIAAAVIERRDGTVIAARARVADDGGVPARAFEGPREISREVLGVVEWARAYARTEATARCEALSVRSHATWIAQARGATGRFVIALVADRSAQASAVLERARIALLAIERVAL